MIKIHKNKYVFWAIVVSGILLLGFVLSSALKPFVISFILAYIFVPVVDRLEKKRVHRGLTAAVIVLLIFTLILTIISILIPYLYTQTIELLKFTSYRTEGAGISTSSIKNIAKLMNLDYTTAHNLIENITHWIRVTILDSVKVNSKDLIHTVPYSFAIIFVIPIISFYMIKDWKKMLSAADSLVPLSSRRTVERLARQIDDSIFAYIRGQLNVCIFFSVYYSICFSILGVNLGFLLGLAMGIIMFIPYIGFFVGFVVCMIIAFLQFGISNHFCAIGIVFLIGQLIDANYTTPKFVGDKVGIHPVIIVFGLFASTIVFGITGALLALPITTIVTILTRYAFGLYKKTLYFKE